LFSEILEVPTKKSLEEEVARRYFRDAVLGLEYRKWCKLCYCVRVTERPCRPLPHFCFPFKSSAVDQFREML